MGKVAEDTVLKPRSLLLDGFDDLPAPMAKINAPPGCNGIQVAVTIRRVEKATFATSDDRHMLAGEGGKACIGVPDARHEGHL